MKNSNDTIGNRTRNLPLCSAVPQRIAPPHVLIICFIATFVGMKGYSGTEVDSGQSVNYNYVILTEVSVTP